MDSDLYIYAEIREEDDQGDEIWEAVLAEYGLDLDPDLEPVPEPFYQGRNPVLLAVFCDCRDEAKLPVAAPLRGLPHNVSSPIYSVFPERAKGASWLYLSEVLEYRWDLPVQIDGYVSLEEYEKCLDENRPPRRYGQNLTTGEKVEILAATDYATKKKTWFSSDIVYYVAMEWTSPVRNLAPLFWEETVPRLRELTVEEDRRDVRLVYWLAPEDYY